MPKPACTFCGEYEGVLMATNLDDGDTQVVCGPEFPMYALSLAIQAVAMMTPEQIEVYGQLLEQLYGTDPRPPKAPPAAKRGKGKLTVVPELPPDGPTIDAEPPVQLLRPCDHCQATTGHGEGTKLVCDGCGAVLAEADDTAG